ncbi:MAG: DUF2269 family protein [Rhizomicrobium sp.]|jgi:hypothetical protein
MAYRILKLLHLLGLTLFLGSIFGHIVSSVLGGAVGGTPAFVAAREHIALATDALTLPGLGLAILTGFGMVLVGRLSPLRAPWLIVHAGLGILIAVLAWFVIVPAVSHVLEGALELANGGRATIASVVALKRIEDVAGACNILLTLAAMTIAVWKPQFRTKTS